MYEEIAKKIVEESLNITKDDSVVVHSWEHTLDFASSIAHEVQRKGANYLFTADTDLLFLNTMNELSDELMLVPPKLSMHLLDCQTVNISIEGPKDPSIFEKLRADRFGILGEKWKAYEEKFRKKKIKSLNIQLGLVTPERAKKYGINYNLWMEEMKSALNVSYKELNQFGKQVVDKMSGVKKIHIEGPGTDITFEITDRTIHVHDGVIDVSDLAKGTHFGGLPSGSIEVAPLETTANGRVVATLPEALLGEWVKGLDWNFEDGKVTSINAEENIELWNKPYEGGTGDKNRIASLILGINPNAKSGFLHNHIVKGIVGIGIGDNKWIGGNNDATWFSVSFISNATVTLDGKLILKNGEFVL